MEEEGEEVRNIKIRKLEKKIKIDKNIRIGKGIEKIERERKKIFN